MRRLWNVLFWTVGVIFWGAGVFVMVGFGNELRYEYKLLHHEVVEVDSAVIGKRTKSQSKGGTSYRLELEYEYPVGKKHTTWEITTEAHYDSVKYGDLVSLTVSVEDPEVSSLTNRYPPTRPRYFMIYGMSVFSLMGAMVCAVFVLLSLLGIDTLE